MKMKLPSAETTNSFTFALLLDDVFDSPDSSFDEEICSDSEINEDNIYCQKDIDEDISTNIISSNLSSFASPVKNSSSKKKSTLICKINHKNVTSKMKVKNKKQIKSFLSTCFVDSENEETKCNFNSSLESSLSPKPITFTPHHRQSIFSHEARIVHSELIEKENKIKDIFNKNNKKITSNLLKQSLKGKHYDRVIKKLNRIIEICKLCPNA